MTAVEIEEAMIFRILKLQSKLLPAGIPQFVTGLLENNWEKMRGLSNCGLLSILWEDEIEWSMTIY